jgi:hypothetical protein
VYCVRKYHGASGHVTTLATLWHMDIDGLKTAPYYSHQLFVSDATKTKKKEPNAQKR